MMSYPKDPAQYPLHCYDILYAATAEPVRISFADSKEAASYRHRLHAFRRALQHTGDSRYMEVEGIVISLSDNDLILRDLGKQVREAIKRGGQEIPPAPLTEEQTEASKRFDEFLARTLAEQEKGKEEEKEDEQEPPAKRETHEEVIARLYGTKEGERPFSAFGDLLKKPEAEGK